MLMSVFSPYIPRYQALWCRDHPHLADQMTEAIAQEAVLRMHEATGRARRSKRSGGRMWLVPTGAYLTSIDA
jgi:hypothetical protein